ncbi:uncharacterized protein LOC106180033 isoform X2 [Lingula anatina]|uniref:Uncharacterized protein LOC106171381 isoform X2 n=1 Tax=Lingula anatina TaxID=7574 RepID=A0A1S3JB95_LINAN|nr:uncharacterized protein LOC106171381 isoform X2 [Lingula anatina]XP_013419351.1 uncharacterized protein LOC106180033 isoform X2 [Lingula anatina]|eukprot:XP_013407154.1 uncharacterized protein LOC106171381 isoform X2 [Lingula anatina]
MAANQIGQTPWGVYMFISYKASLVDYFIKDLEEGKLMFQKCGGEITCISRELHEIEGKWKRDMVIAVLWFPDVARAQKWLINDPIAQSPDWLEGAEIVVLPIAKEPPSEKKMFLFIDLEIHDAAKFHQYMETLQPSLEDVGCTPTVVVTPTPVNSRGDQWVPRFVVVHQWDNMENFNNFYNSEEYRPLKDLRHSCAQSNMVLFSNDVSIATQASPS